ncbi:lactate/malate family dehydrogenase [Streptomyces boncukensis]|uniref:NAD(P)-binding domain-containing protein n=1 Tax=Streptomyces boncukensis TaxID=2711219 RepID=A0A6G4X0J3_9ACTN|nr:NAD(P)-binding domain-containing protein [Streptomyces boncukensis]NGO70642.1 NAD(P)-binding domain-containing protein [Streptomyces boncukensis]
MSYAWPPATIGVIGAGAVGRTVGAALVSSGICDRLRIVSRTRDQAAVYADDLADMAGALGRRLRVSAVPVTECTEADAVVVALRARFTNTADRTDIRIGGLRHNAPAIADTARALHGYRGPVLVVTNPVDVMTRLFAETSGCPRVFGIGSNLDAARYRAYLADLFDVAPHEVHGHVIGEHGRYATICASTTTVRGMPVAFPLREAHGHLTTRPAAISDGAGRTRAGPAGAVLSALRHALGHADGTEELSAPYAGGYLGIPVHFTAGHPEPRLPRLNDAETRRFERAQRHLHDTYEELTAHLSSEGIA